MTGASRRTGIGLTIARQLAGGSSGGCLAGGLGRMQQTQRGWMTGEGEESREVFVLAVDRGVNACDWNGHGLAAGSPRSYLRLPVSSRRTLRTTRLPTGPMPAGTPNT